MIILYVALVVFGFFGINYYLFNYGSSKSKSYSSKTAKLKWNDLKNFYYLNPYRWRYERIIMNGYDTIETNYKVLLYNPTFQWNKDIWNHVYCEHDHIVRIRLSVFDYFKFIWFSKYKNPKKIEGIEVVLKCAQKDIDRLKKASNKEIDEANKKMKDIEEKLKEGVTLEV